MDSAALLLFLAADTRVADPRAGFLIHAITLKPDRDPAIHTLRNWLSRLESESQRYAQILKERTKVEQSSLDIIKVLYDGIDKEINTAQAIDIGICTQLIDDWEFPKHGVTSRLVKITH